MEQIGRYKTLGQIGKGGMGVVYRAFDSVLQREVALKTHTVVEEPNYESIERFFREARLIASLRHSNIVTVYDLGQHENSVFIAMELLHGEDLADKLIAKRHLSLEQKLRLIWEIAQGLSHAHHRGIIHRDIKPRNVFVMEDGHVKLLDFGLAHMAYSTLTDAGQVIGTPLYMAPEQVQGEKPDPRSDIFSLGALLYELLTGEKAFGGTNLQEILDRIVLDEPAPIRELEPAIPAELCRIVNKTLSKSMEQRYSGIDDLLQDLTRFGRFLGQYKSQLRDEARVTIEGLDELVRRNKDLLAEQGVGVSLERLVSTAARDDLSYMALVGLRDGANVQKRHLDKVVQKALADKAASAPPPSPADETLSVYQRPASPAPEPTTNDPFERRRKERKAEERYKKAWRYFTKGDLAASLRFVCDALRLDPEHQAAEDLAEHLRLSIVRVMAEHDHPDAKNIDVLVAALLAIDDKGREGEILQGESGQDPQTIAGLSDILLAELPGIVPLDEMRPESGKDSDRSNGGSS